MSLKTNSPYAPRPGVLAARIKSERERLGLSIAECGRRLGVGKSSYVQLEHLANPQTSRLVDLVRVLGMDLRALLPELVDLDAPPTNPPKARRRLTAR